MKNIIQEIKSFITFTIFGLCVFCAAYSITMAAAAQGMIK